MSFTITYRPAEHHDGQEADVNDGDHVLTVHFEDGEDEYVSLTCRRSGADRPCAVIICPVDHEDVTRECIEAHGATARDECWATTTRYFSRSSGVQRKRTVSVRGSDASDLVKAWDGDIWWNA